MTTPQNEYTSKMEEMAKSHTAETAALREEFKREMEQKLAEQRKNMKVKSMHRHSIFIPIVKLRMWLFLMYM